MRKIQVKVTVWTVAVALLAAAPAGATDDRCVVLDASRAHAGAKSELLAAGGWWIELGPELIVCGGEAGPVAGRTSAMRTLGRVDRTRLWVSRGIHPAELAGRGFRVLATHRGYAVLEAVAVERPGSESREHRHAGIAPLPPNTVVLRRRAPSPKAADPGVQAIVDQVDGDRWFADVTTLQTWDRNTHRTEILDARDWIAAELDALPGLQVSTPPFPVGGTTAYNVMAVLPGTTRPDDLYVVGGHYDATSSSCGAGNPAYGAEDNASGAAGVIEVARALAANPPEATVVFMAYSGEEQGLHGSEDHVADLTAAGEIGDVLGVVIMDMIGYSVDASLDVLLETRAVGTTQLNLMAQSAADYTDLVVHETFFAWGSDHVPYLDAGRPSVLTIDDDWDQYSWYHCTTDTIDKLVKDMGVEIVKMNAAAVAQMAGASAPSVVFEDGFESGDVAAWTESVPPSSR